MYYTYILKSVEVGKLYIGCSGDLLKRLREHNQGKVKSTKAYRPWRLIYYEAYLSKKFARQTELFYKTGQGRRQLVKKLNL